MSTTNKWQRIITAVITQLKTIKTTAGYKTNAGTNVYEWLGRPLAEGEMPGIIVRDTFPEEIITVGAHEHTLLIECFVFTSGATATTQAREVIADIVTAFGADRTWGGLVEDTQPAPGGGLGTDQANKAVAIAVKPFELKYTTEPFDPYK